MRIRLIHNSFVRSRPLVISVHIVNNDDDEHYFFTVNEQVEGRQKSALPIHFYGAYARHGTDSQNRYSLFLVAPLCEFFKSVFESFRYIRRARSQSIRLTHDRIYHIDT